METWAVVNGEDADFSQDLTGLTHEAAAEIVARMGKPFCLMTDRQRLAEMEQARIDDAKQDDDLVSRVRRWDASVRDVLNRH